MTSFDATAIIAQAYGRGSTQHRNACTLCARGRFADVIAQATALTNVTPLRRTA
jgi:hypothetical protein